MDADPSSHAWLSGFCAELLRLRPDMSLPAAARCGVAAFAHARELDPREAADIFEHVRERTQDAQRLAMAAELLARTSMSAEVRGQS
jgi:hypothetical protein